ncbi:hypothetical protein FRZ06_10135 [Anoxybacterium hadale]|uniref:Uncharacterized protein n=1 Tax=Anoxybacterium hadale TaxID=3408580 RepID=A0ACD1AAX0_9FIRM|nr:hypothetical protein FRZ06_10135 [Clostridiales bacterium]
MARKISIEIVAQDNFTKTLKNMRSDTQKFNKDLETLGNKLSKFNESMTIDTSSAEKGLENLILEISNTKAALKSLQDEMVHGVGSETMAKESENIVQGNQNAEKSFGKLKKTIQESSLAGEMKKLGLDQFSEAVINTTNKAVSVYSKSALGDEEGTMVSNAFSMGLMGAQMGAFAGIAGALTGAAIGVGIGLINGALENYSKRDDSFKAYYGKQYNDIDEAKNEMITSAASLSLSKAEGTILLDEINKLKGLNDENLLAAGNAYQNKLLNDDENKGDIYDQIAFLESDEGKKNAEIDTEYADFMAGLENKKQAYDIEAKKALVADQFDQNVINDLKNTGYSDESIERFKTMNEEFKNSDTSVLQKKNLQMEAGAISANEYAGDEDVQKVKDSNLELISNLQTSAEANDAGWVTVREINNKLTEGLMAAGKEGTQIIPVRGITPAAYRKQSAYGLNYVPYNNFPAMLHEGERVLTASENRGYGKGGGVTVTGNNFTVREEADIGKIARALFREIEKTRMVMAY